MFCALFLIIFSRILKIQQVNRILPFVTILASPSELLDRISAVEEPTETTDRLLCGAIKQLRIQRAKPNMSLVLALSYMCKAQPDMFNTDMVTGVWSTMSILSYFIM